MKRTPGALGDGIRLRVVVALGKTGGVPSAVPKPGESLADLFPGLAAEWDSERNDGLSPSDVSASIYKRVWWQCREGLDHQWAAPIADRTKKDRGCPSCAGQKVSVTNSLATIAPDVASPPQRVG